MIWAFEVVGAHPLGAQLVASGRLRLLGREQVEDAIARRVGVATGNRVVAVAPVAPMAGSRLGEYFHVLLTQQRGATLREGLLLLRLERVRRLPDRAARDKAIAPADRSARVRAVRR